MSRVGIPVVAAAKGFLIKKEPGAGETTGSLFDLRAKKRQKPDKKLRVGCLLAPAGTLDGGQPQKARMGVTMSDDRH